MTTRRGSKRKGTDYERAYRKDLEGRGYHVMRSAGSHGPFDLFAWNDVMGTRGLVQTKDDDRGCFSAQVLANRLRITGQAPLDVKIQVIHRTKELRFCPHLA